MTAAGGDGAAAQPEAARPEARWRRSPRPDGDAARGGGAAQGKAGATRGGVQWAAKEGRDGDTQPRERAADGCERGWGHGRAHERRRSVTR